MKGKEEASRLESVRRGEKGRRDRRQTNDEGLACCYFWPQEGVVYWGRGRRSVLGGRNTHHQCTDPNLESQLSTAYVHYKSKSSGCTYHRQHQYSVKIRGWINRELAAVIRSRWDGAHLIFALTYAITHVHTAQSRSPALASFPPKNMCTWMDWVGWIHLFSGQYAHHLLSISHTCFIVYYGAGQQEQSVEGA